MTPAAHDRSTRQPFSEVARPHLPWLYSLARRLVGRERAEDLVQECLARAYRGYDRLRDTDAAAAWLKRILTNCAHDAARHDARRVREVPVDAVDGWSLYRTLVDEDPLPYSDTLHLDFLSAFGVEDVWAVLDRLPGTYRVPLVLVHMEGYAVKEVAALQRAPVGTVLSRLSRGRKLFERELWAYATSNDLLASRQGVAP